MKIKEMLYRKLDCAKSFEETGEGKNCRTCRLCDQVTLKSRVGEPEGFFLEGTEVNLVVNPCLLLDELASKIKQRSQGER